MKKKIKNKLFFLFIFQLGAIILIMGSTKLLYQYSFFNDYSLIIFLIVSLVTGFSLLEIIGIEECKRLKKND